MCVFRSPVLQTMLIAFSSLYCTSTMAVEETTLTVEETIASIYAPRLSVSAYRHANPAAMGEVHRIIDDCVENDLGFSRGMGAVLGFHGGNADAEKVLKVVRMQEGRTDSGQIIPIAMASLGLMAHRGVQSAREILSEMTDKSFWASLKVRTLPEEFYRQFPDLYTVNAASARYLIQFSEGAPLTSVGDLMLEMYPHRVDDDQANMRFTYQLAMARKSVESLKASATDVSRFNLESDTRKNLRSIYERRVLGTSTDEKASKAHISKLRTPESAEEMMSQVIRPDAAVPEEAKAFYAEQAKEAIAAFQSFFAERVEADDYDALRGRILDDGKPQVPRLVEKYWPEIRQELEDTQGPIFRALRTEGLAPDAGQYTSGQAEDGSYIVTMPIPNSGALVDEHWKATGQEAQVLAEGFAISDSLELVLVMRKIEGVWYWNPFGW